MAALRHAGCGRAACGTARRRVVSVRPRAAGKEAEARPSGSVTLVGAGPGDVGLLTLHAVAALRAADVVLYDRLVSDEVLALVPDGTRMVYVGKEAGYHTRTQDEIEALLAEEAAAGARVVRLKGGDPTVFGRGGEEALHLAAHGVEVGCIPGITSAAGIAARLGVPLTHRGVATSVRYLTGHAQDGGHDPAEFVFGAADADTTLVVYMGLQTLPVLTARMLDAGLPPDTPAVAVERGTTPKERRVFATLVELSAAVAAAELRSPTLVFVGRTVALSPLWDPAGTVQVQDGPPPGAPDALDLAAASAAAAAFSPPAAPPLPGASR